MQTRHAQMAAQELRAGMPVLDAKSSVDELREASTQAHDTTATLRVGRVPFAPTPGAGSSELRIIGSHGHLTIDENRPQLDVFSTATERRGLPIGGESARGSVATEIGEFIEDIRDNRAQLYGVEDGWAAVAAIDAAYRSVAAGQPARVIGFPPRPAGAAAGRSASPLQVISDE